MHPDPDSARASVRQDDHPRPSVPTQSCRDDDSIDEPIRCALDELRIA